MGERHHRPRGTTDDGSTPMPVVMGLWRESGGFDLDPCGQAERHPPTQWIVQHGGRCYDGSKAELDGLLQPWRAERVFMNPPYGHKELLRFTTKAIREIECGNTGEVWGLLPARKTEQGWWQKNVMGEWRRDGESRPHPLVKMVRFVSGRLSFGGGQAPFSSCVVVWEKLL